VTSWQCLKITIMDMHNNGHRHPVRVPI
jgi:hypothetical protein